MHLRKCLINTGIIFLSIGLVAVAIEIILRFTPFRHLLERDQYLKNYYRADREKGFDIRPNVPKIRTSVDQQQVEYDVWSNDLGCFDEPYRDEREVILLVGDSFTHSYAPFLDKWGTQVEKLLDYRVLKCGVSGYGTKQELLKAKDIIARIKCQPRLIVVGYFWNDLHDDYSFPNLTVVDGLLVPSAKYLDPKTAQLKFAEVEREFSFWEKFTPRYPLSFLDLSQYWLSQHSLTFNLISGALARLFPARYAYPSPEQFLTFQDRPELTELWRKHEENLVAFKKLATQNGAHLLIVLIPTNSQVYPFLVKQANMDLERPNRILGQFLHDEQIDYLDLLPLFRRYADQTPRPMLSPEKDLYWRYNSHFSLNGEHLAGLLVARYILERQLVQVKDRARKLQEIDARLRVFR